MRYKKHMIILLAAIFLFAMATASATDSNDTAVAVEDMQLTDEIIQASENQENTIQASNNDEVNLSEDDPGKLAIGNDKKLGKTVTGNTFNDINNAIESDCTIYLEPGTYNGGSQILIDGKSNIKIIGDSTILDAQGKTRIFYITGSSNITIQNIIFKNGYTGGYGGAIYVYGNCLDCSISNCTFINNHAGLDGGAIEWATGCNNGRVSNCTFINNHAERNGGAIDWYDSNDGRVNNCTFINNTAEANGDAIYAASCDLNADYNWFGNTADNYNDQLPITWHVKCDYRLFLNATANPDTITGKDTSNITFKLYQYNSGVISDYDNAPFKNLNLTITATNGNVKGTAKLGEPIQFTPTGKGTASVTATVENVRQTAEINVLKGDFDLLQDLVNNESLSIINLERNYTYNEFDTITDGVRINRPITINGNGFTIDAKGKSRIFYVTAGSINITDVTLKNGKADLGGAIYFENDISNSNINATYINNTAGHGGANYFRGSVSGSNIGGTYTNNTATNDGGANNFGSVSGSNVSGTYINNTAKRYGGANFFDWEVSTSNVSGTYINNTAKDWGGANYFNLGVSGSNVSGTYTNNKAEENGGANYFNLGVSGSNVSGTYTNNKAEWNGGANYFYSSVSGSNVSGTYTNNKAEWNGGANYFSSVSGSNVSGTYTNNTATNGGGANYFTGSVSGSNVSGTYTNNKANGRNDLDGGGANYFYSSVSGSNIGGTYTNNTATNDGGANNFGTVSTSNISGTYTNNKAERNGGANYFSSVSGSNVGGIYINNTALNAVIYFEDYFYRGLDANITNAIFLNNNCTYEIYTITRGIVVKDSWFGNNASNYMNKPNINDNVQMDGWLFLNGTNDHNNIKFFLMGYDGTTVSEYDNILMPKINLTIATTDGILDKSTVDLDEPVKFSPTEIGIKRVTAQIEDATQTIEFTNGDFDLLQTIVNNATSSVINLTRNYTYNELDTITEGVRITRPITINGNGFTIDAKGKSRIFRVTAGSINITDVTLKNGKADRGGAIYFENAISNSSINATYINNTAGQGGANYFNKDVSGSNVSGTYINNAAKGVGGANYFYSVSTSNISGTYTNNKAEWNGGANFFYWSVSGSNIGGTYTNNKVNGRNDLEGGGANYFEGGVFGSNVGGTYINNKAEWNGGANYFLGSVSGSNVSGTYTNNKVNGRNDLDGGGANFFWDSVSGSNISGTYINNTATNDGGANNFGLVSTSNISGTYINNKAEGNGGANRFGGVSGSNVSGTYINNTAEQGSGGANYFRFSVLRSNIAGIYINNTASRGVIIYFIVYSNTILTNVTIENAIFLNNNYNESMGVIFAEKTGVVAKNNWFGNNATNYNTQPKTTGIQMDSWLFLNATADPNSISVFDSSDILFKLYSTNGTHISGYDNSKLPVVNLTLNATNGEVSNSTVLDKSVEYMPTKVGQGSVTASVEDAEYTIFLDNNKRDVNLSVAVDPSVIDYGENAAVIFEYNVTATGTVNITLKGKKHNQTIENVALNKTITLPDTILPDEYEVTVSYSGDDVFVNASAASSLTVNQLKSDIKVVGYDIYVNDTIGLLFSVTLPENATGNLTINNIITLNVTKDGRKENISLIIEIMNDAYSVGQYNWTFTYSGDDIYENSEANATANILIIPTEITANATSSLFVDDTGQVTYNVTPENAVGDVRFTSNDTSVVEVDQNGNIKAIAEGTAIITVTFEGCENYTASSTNVTVTVSKIATEITLTNATVELKAYGNIGDLATLAPAGAGNLTYASSDEDIVLVSDDGIIYARVKGTATVTVSFAGDNKYKAAENKTITVTVTLNDASVSTENDTIDLYVDDTCIINATANPSFLTVYYTSSNESVATVTEYGNVKAVGEGTAVITLTVGNGETYALNSTNVTVTVSKVPTEIGIENYTLKLEVTNEVDTGATLTPADAGNVTYTISNSSIVKVKDGKIIALAEGEATITVSFTGDDKYADAENRTITVAISLKPASVSVNNDTLDLFVDDTFNLVATTEPKDLTVNFTSSNPSIVTIDNDGNVVAVGEGTANITVSVGGDGVYAENSTTVTVTVSKIPTEIKVNSPVGEMSAGAMGHVAAELIPSYAGNLTYASNDTSVATVSSTGVIKANMAGTALITVSFAGDDKYAAAENKTITLTVNLNDASISVNNSTLELLVDDNFTIVATTDPAGLNVTYVPDDSGVVSVDENGIVTALKEGTATITVKVGGDGVYAENSTEISITVSKIPTEIIVQNATVDMKVTDEVTPVVSLMPSDAGELDFTSSDVSVVTVDGIGTITAVGEGVANVTVRFIGNDKYAAAENKTITVNVRLNDASVSINNATLDLFVDDTFTIVANTTPVGLNVTYVPDNSGVVSVDENGIVTALKEGIASITVKVGGDGVYAENSTTVTVTVNKIPTEIIVQNATVNMKVDDEFDPVVSLMPSNAGNLSFKSNNGSVVIVNAYGIITAVGEGEAIVTVAFSGNEKYAAESKNITVTVSLIDASVSVNNSTLDLLIDDTFTLVVTTNPAGLNVTYVPDNSGVVNVTSDGVVTALKEGTATILVKVGGDGVYAENSTTIAVTVNKQNATADVSMPDNITVGDNSTVDVTLPSGAGGKVTLKVDGEVVDEVNVTNGTASVELPGLSAGNHTVEIAYSGDSKYNPVNQTKEITVSKKDTTPEITIPSDIEVGDNSTVNVVLPEDATGNVTVMVDGEVADTVAVTDGTADVTIPSLSAGNHTVEIAYSGDGKYNPSNETKEIVVSKKETTPDITIPSDITVGDDSNIEIKLPSDASGNVTLKVDGEVVDTVPVKDGTASVKLPELDAGNHTVEITYSGDDKYKSASKTAIITVNKDSTNITAADVTATYKVNKYLVIKLTDSMGNPLANSTVTVELSTAKNYTTDENGQIKVKVSSLVPKTYTAKITFKGDDKYTGSNTTTKVTVKKATAKITAKAKTFKTTTKTKKYTVMLKANGKALKNKWVYLKVNGKTYKAKTNSKGKATFKITQLNKAGKFKATVTFKGSKYYKKVTKKVSIKVKSVWKTVQKGSKEKAIVKKIQRALKNHGYYLTYNGRYLKVDGIFWDYTKMAVKEFQNDKTLKVTGKVDEKTAKKLGII